MHWCCVDVALSVLGWHLQSAEMKVSDQYMNEDICVFGPRFEPLVTRQNRGLHVEHFV